MDRWVEYQQRRIVKKLNVSDKSILDMGCGIGDYLAIFAESMGKGNVAGLDIFTTEMEGIKIYKGTGEKLPFKANSFDIVFEKDAVHHIDDKKKAIAEMKRVAGKEVILVEANLNNGVMAAVVDKKVHHHFSPKTLAELLKGEKFEMFFVEAFPFGSNRILPLKLFNFIPRFISNPIFWLVGKVFDLFENERAAFIVCKIRAK